MKKAMLNEGREMGNMNNWKRITVFIVIILAVILVSSFLASSIQTSGFTVKMTELKNVINTGFVNDDSGQPTNVAVNGKVVHGMLFVPSNASASNPVAGICLSHGYLNNWQFQLQNAIELSRRGFVVLAVDQEGHGDNNNAENWPAGGMAWTENDGLYLGVQYLYNLDYVDKTKVGVSAHSMGAETVDSILAQDSEKYQDFCINNPGITPKGKGLGIISAALLQGFDPVDFAGPFGAIDIGLWNSNVSVGLLKASDDEFFYINTFPDGTKSRCRDYLHSVHAAVFTKTSYTKGDNGSIKIMNGGVYADGKLKSVNARKAVGIPFRAIYQDAHEIHPLNHFSVQGAAYVVKFFYTAFGTPVGAKYVPSTNQTWWLKEACSTIGLICFFLLLIPLSVLLLKIPFFADLKDKSVALVGKNENADIGGIKLYSLKSTRKHITYWVSGIACAIFAGATFCNLYALGGTYFPRTSWFPQDTTNPVLFWASCVGLFTVAVILVGYIINYIINKVNHQNDFEAYNENPFLSCIMPTGLVGFLKTFLLAALSVMLMYAVVFINWKIWQVDFRFWSFNVKTFDVFRLLPAIIRYLPVFAIFYCINAFANSTYRVKNLPEWASIAINVFMNVIGVVMVIWVNYAKLMATGSSPTFMLPLIVIFPLVAILPIVTVLSRILYKRTGNIWYGAFVNTMLITIITVVNTAASFAYVVL